MLTALSVCGDTNWILSNQPSQGQAQALLRLAGIEDGVGGVLQASRSGYLGRNEQDVVFRMTDQNIEFGAAMRC
ncbi:hypothetical protein D9M68_343570 [compost metagenome]